MLYLETAIPKVCILYVGFYAVAKSFSHIEEGREAQMRVDSIYNALSTILLDNNIDIM